MPPVDEQVVDRPIPAMRDDLANEALDEGDIGGLGHLA